MNCRTGSGYWPDNIFCSESFDDIDNFAEPFWDIDGPKTAPKYNLTQFSLPYRGYAKITIDCHD